MFAKKRRAALVRQLVAKIREEQLVCLVLDNFGGDLFDVDRVSNVGGVVLGATGDGEIVWGVREFDPAVAQSTLDEFCNTPACMSFAQFLTNSPTRPPVCDLPPKNDCNGTRVDKLEKAQVETSALLVKLLGAVEKLSGTVDEIRRSNVKSTKKTAPAAKTTAGSVKQSVVVDPRPDVPVDLVEKWVINDDFEVLPYSVIGNDGTEQVLSGIKRKRGRPRKNTTGVGK